MRLTCKPKYAIVGPYSHLNNLFRSKPSEGGKEQVVTNRYVEFHVWLENQGWQDFGRLSLAKKLKVTESTIFRALRGDELQPRTMYRLWKATGKCLECFNIEATPLQIWLYDHDMTERQLAEMTGLPVGAVKHYVYENGKPSAENAAVLYKHTGLAIYSPEEDPAAATARLLHDQGSSRTTADSEQSVEKKPVRMTERPLPQLVDRPMPKLSASGSDSGSLLEKLLEEVLDLVKRSMSSGDPFEQVVAILRHLRENDQAERDAFIERIGKARFRYWVSMLTAMSDPEEFSVWQKMSDHSLGG